MHVNNLKDITVKIIVRSNETGRVVAEYVAPTQAECDVWVNDHYDINDYTWSYA